MINIYTYKNYAKNIGVIIILNVTKNNAYSFNKQ